MDAAKMEFINPLRIRPEFRPEPFCFTVRELGCLDAPTLVDAGGAHSSPYMPMRSLAIRPRSFQ